MKETVRSSSQETVVARCSGCGAVDHPTKPLPWFIPYQDNDFPADLYCENCYRDMRRHEEAEEAVIAALKAARLHETYTIAHLARAVDGIFGCYPEAIEAALETGTMSKFRPRTSEDDGAARFDWKRVKVEPTR